MTLEGEDNELEHHIEQYGRNKQRLEKILDNLRLIVEEVEKGLYRPEEPHGEESA